MGGEPRTLGPDAPANVGRTLLAALLACVISACGGAGTTATGPTNGTNSGSSGTATYNVDLLGVPQFVNVVYIDLTQTDPATHGPLINQISKFRSSAGHDYSDSTEGCRSMKHYFSFPDGATKLYAPVAGTVTQSADEDKISIQADAQPAFLFTIFHPKLNRTFAVGEHVAEGQILGTHVGNWTSSDIAVLVNPGNAGPAVGVGPSGRLVSYFDTLTDAAFQVFRARGINSRSDLIISRALRDANPLTCSGQTFTTLNDPLPAVVRF